ncbi:hypothetical protein BT63DRAFT_461637 [Microthyrium microscopicum]|uniref:Uncharacterized protein n=1 Tax=Microthyrium microscopicum TaxID=703497 RepID=A0A6A6TSR7_9PEZI|nr:hypothetical protein BT63DRAFT_461637 [Microthyrium microscopicum]
MLAERDWLNFPKTLPVVKASIDTGHLGTYWSLNGGQFGKITVAYLKYMFYADQGAKKLFLEPNSSLVADGWNISTRNWN